jgi:hypothetical protein
VKLHARPVNDEASDRDDEASADLEDVAAERWL